MFKYFLFFILSISNLSCNSQQQKSSLNYFHKVNRSCDFTNSSKLSYYKIEFIKERNPLVPCSYFFDFKKYKEKEKLKMIEELLRYK